MTNKLCKYLLLSALGAASLSTNSKTWDLYAKWNATDRWDMQAVAWNDNNGQMYIFEEDDETKIVRPIIVSNGDPASRTMISGYALPAHQNFDIFNSEIYHTYGGGIGVWNINLTSPNPHKVYPLPIDDSKATLPQGYQYNGWTWINTAVDDNYGAVSPIGPSDIPNYFVKSAFPNATGNDAVDRKYRHVFVYQYNVNTGNPQLIHTWPLQNVAATMQGIEITNNRVYAYFGGVECYYDEDRLYVQEYTFEGELLRTHRFDSDKVISTGWQERATPCYLKMEAEGITTRRGKIYPGVRYDYGVIRKYKSLIYEAMDSSNSPSPSVFNADFSVFQNPYGSGGINDITIKSASTAKYNTSIVNYKWVVDGKVISNGSAKSIMITNGSRGRMATIILYITDSRGKKDSIKKDVYLKPGEAGGCGPNPKLGECNLH